MTTINGKVDLAQVGGTDISGADIIDTTNGAVKTVSPGFSSIGDGSLTVTTAGTRVQFSSQAAKKVFITANTGNTDVVVVGGSTVVAAAGTRRGVPLFPGSSFTIEVNNLNLLYLDSVVNSEGVTFVYAA